MRLGCRPRVPTSRPQHPASNLLQRDVVLGRARAPPPPAEDVAFLRAPTTLASSVSRKRDEGRAHWSAAGACLRRRGTACARPHAACTPQALPPLLHLKSRFRSPLRPRPRSGRRSMGPRNSHRGGRHTTPGVSCVPGRRAPPRSVGARAERGLHGPRALSCGEGRRPPEHARSVCRARWPWAAQAREPPLREGPDAARLCEATPQEALLVGHVGHARRRVVSGRGTLAGGEAHRSRWER